MFGGLATGFGYPADAAILAVGVDGVDLAIAEAFGVHIGKLPVCDKRIEAFANGNGVAQLAECRNHHQAAALGDGAAALRFGIFAGIVFNIAH